MFRLLALCLILSLSLPNLQAQDTPEYSRVRILLDEEMNMEKLNTLGVLCHGNHAAGKHFTSDFSRREIRIIKEAGFETEILIEDVQAHYVNQNLDGGHHHDHREGQVDCEESGGSEVPVPENFELGSIGGYLSYQEILAELDEMKSLYPNLISTKAPISSTLLTHEGREVLWVRISDNPEMDENEPEVLYNSLTHAREPGGMQQLMFYMWYLLENYDSDDEVKYLVDNVEMYFIPCVNPDGYIYNETTNPNGGGLWRKNRRDNGDGTFGVDLNRNFSYAFADDNSGSSPNPNSDTYRGPFAFSEPESQLVKMFVESHDFIISMNYHTYSKLLLRPWGHTLDLPDDIETFDAFGQLMVEENGYQYGGAEILGYFVNGDTDSWMYGDENVISYTPEVGSSFWSPIAEITEDGKDNLAANLYVARFVLNYGRANELNGEEELTSLNGMMDLNIKKYGYATGQLTATFSSAQMVNSPAPIPMNLTHLEEFPVTFNYELDPSLEDGDEVVFLLEISNGEHSFQQTFTKVMNTTLNDATAVVDDNGTNMDAWDNATAWGITNARYFSAPTSIADSPQSDYSNNTESFLALNAPIDLSNAVDAFVTFKAEWDIESNYDYTQLQASTESTSFAPLCGKYTRSGSQYQDYQEPVWDGGQTGWVTEKLVLDDYLGQNEVNLRFRLVSDQFVTGDGFFFDDFQVIVLNEAGASTYEFTAEDFNITSYPNPVTHSLNIQLSKLPQDAQLTIYNTVGQAIRTEIINDTTEEIKLDDLSNGIYFYTIHSNGALWASRKVVVAK